jgi:hypothetical protein
MHSLRGPPAQLQLQRKYFNIRRVDWRHIIIVKIYILRSHVDVISISMHGCKVHEPNPSLRFSIRRSLGATSRAYTSHSWMFLSGLKLCMVRQTAEILNMHSDSINEPIIKCAHCKK